MHAAVGSLRRMSRLVPRAGESAAPQPARTYASAIQLLNSLQSNAAVIEAIRKSGGKGGEAQVLESIEYLKRIGYAPADLDALNVIHVTGTKGKGSTCAFTDSLLRTMAPDARVGFYSSPHLVAVRERIRINGQPIAEELFAKYFYEVWERLERDTTTADPDTPAKPAYFRYLTVMAFHVFLQEKVDATILEVGVGGTFDSTNIVPSPIVAGVTSLGIDHVFVLGKTIPEIATQKGGIYKAGVPALAISQPAEGLDVLRSRAAELNASSFTVLPILPELSTITLGLAGAHQRTNASLALGLVHTFLSSSRVPPAFSNAALPSGSSLGSPLPKIMVDGLVSTRWPGRCQIAHDSTNPALTWFLDGAHTIESIECCAEWFHSTSTSNATRALIFNCTSGRSGNSLLSTLLAGLSKDPFSHVIFCTNTTYAGGVSKGDLTSNAVDVQDLEALTVQRELEVAWGEVAPGSTAQVHVLGSIEEAVVVARGLEGRTEVLVTGSLHLVGGTMAFAELPLDS